MPLPASLFLQRGRSDSMMDLLDEDGTATAPSPTINTSRQDSLSIIRSDNLELDESGAPMYTPPITMTAFDNSYGPHGLLASAMSCSYEAPRTQAPNALNLFNPRANLLRRTSSSSTLDSSEDEEEVTWSAFDVERLTAVYEACVEEASFETPFSGPPPSQLLHAIAKACRRAYKEDWPHSITQTRLKANQIAREKERLENGDWMNGFGSRRPSVEATPKPPGQGGKEAEAEPTPRRRLRRNDSMDFLPESWDLGAVAKLSDKLNKSGEDDPHLYHYPHRLRTDTSSSGSNDQGCPLRSAPMPGRLLRSMTFTALNNMDEEASFASSSMAQLPASIKEDHERSSNYAQYSLAQSDPNLQLSMSSSMSSSRRPSLKPGFGMYFNETQSKFQQHQPNTLYHAPSNNSLFSEAPSSIYSNNSLNNSMDTMALSSYSNNGSSIYGSSFASTASSGFSSLNGKKRMLQSFNNYDNDDNEEIGSDHNASWTLNGPFSLPPVSTTAVNSARTPSTPSILTDGQGPTDYFSALSTSILDANAATPKDITSVSTTSNKKRPHPGNLNTNTTKPPLHKSYTFDAISTSPTKKYMRMDEGWSSFQPGQPYANGIGLRGSTTSSNNGGMMLESPFEMDFGASNLKPK